MRTFPLKQGSCHIYPEGIEIRQPGFMARIAGRLGGRKLYLNLLVSLLLLLAMFIALLIRNYLLTSFFAAMAAFYAFLTWQQRDISFSKYIARDSIETVFFNEAIPGQSRASFTIWYKNRRNRRLQRKILLPSSNEQDSMVLQSAIQIMREENLLSS